MKKILILLLLIFTTPALAQNYYEQGKTEFYKKNYIQAQQLFLKELQYNPENYPCRYFLAHSYAYSGNIIKAKEEYNKIIIFSPVDSVKKLAIQSMYNLNHSEKNNTKTNSYSYSNADNYYEYIKLQENYVKWKNFPINVYVSPCEYSHIIKNAFLQWEKATDGLVSFNFVGNIAAAKITVSMVDTLKIPTNNNFEAGLATVQAKNNIIYKSHIDILRNNPQTGEKFDNALILTTSMHEVGHALGLQGHSPNNQDLMSAINHTGTKRITQRDLNTLKKLYSQ